MEISKMITLSTGHLPEVEFRSLSLDQYYSFSYINYPYGAILTVTDDDGDDEKTIKFFPFLWRIIQYARKNKIHWINFDEDGPEEDEFEKFYW